MSIVNSRSKRIAVICVAAALVVGGGGAAFAYWTSTGSGSGTATTGEATAFDVTSTAPVGDDLVPGGPGQTVTFTVSNPSEGTLNLDNVDISIAEDNGDPWIAVDGCSADDYSIAAPTITYGQIAGGGEIEGTVVVTMVNSASNQDACQNVEVPLYFVAS